MKWRGRPLPRGAALIYRAEMWRKKRREKRITQCDVVLESQDTNLIPVTSRCSTTGSSPSEFSNIHSGFFRLLPHCFSWYLKNKVAYTMGWGKDF